MDEKRQPPDTVYVIYDRSTRRYAQRDDMRGWLWSLLLSDAATWGTREHAQCVLDRAFDMRANLVVTPMRVGDLTVRDPDPHRDGGMRA